MILNHQLLKAIFTKDMKALEQSGIFVEIEADTTGELVLQLLEEILGYVLRFSHSHRTGCS